MESSIKSPIKSMGLCHYELVKLVELINKANKKQLNYVVCDLYRKNALLQRSLVKNSKNILIQPKKGGIST